MPDRTTTITLTAPARWANFIRAALAKEARRDARLSDMIVRWTQNGEHSAVARERAAVMRAVARQLGGGDGG